MASPTVYFVGCGPGDPDLITIKGKKILEAADTVVFSGSLIPKEILGMCVNATIHDAAGMIREEIFEILLNSSKKGITVRLHDGDPTIYGAIREQMDKLKEKSINCVIIPGVTSFLASAAALGIQMTLPGVTQSIIITRAESRTAVPKKESIASFAEHGATMVFYLSIHLLKDIVENVIKGGYKKTTPVGVVYRASWSDEKVIRGTLEDIVKKVWEQKITRTAIIIIGDVIEPETYEYAKLYDKNFSHGYRKAEKN